MEKFQEQMGTFQGKIMCFILINHRGKFDMFMLQIFTCKYTLIVFASAFLFKGKEREKDSLEDFPD
jgi:hypothetical protein